jgi:DNA-binding NarL/FixJ family response regulator
VTDDHDVLRSGLCLILEAHANWQVVAEASDGKEALSRSPIIVSLSCTVKIRTSVLGSFARSWRITSSLLSTDRE